MYCRWHSIKHWFSQCKAYRGTTVYYNYTFNAGDTSCFRYNSTTVASAVVSSPKLNHGFDSQRRRSCTCFSQTWLFVNTECNTWRIKLPLLKWYLLRNTHVSRARHWLEGLQPSGHHGWSNEMRAPRTSGIALFVWTLILCATNKAVCNVRTEYNIRYKSW